MSIPEFQALFNYADLRKQFPTAKVFRAGALILHAGRLLMVHHAEIISKKRVPERRGFPKGSFEACDKSALDTARREVREETGLDIFTRKFIIRPTAIIMPYQTSEMHIYFLVDAIGDRPQVKICDPREIAGYSWYDLVPLASKDCILPQFTFSAHNILGVITDLIFFDALTA